MKTIFLLLIISILMEATVTTIPLTLLIILTAAIIFRTNEVFILAFISGLFLDILTLYSLGWSSMYFIILVFVIFLYQKKFEIETLHFVIASSLLASFGYLLIQGSDYFVLQSTAVCIIASVSFLIYTATNKKAAKYA